MNKLIQKKYHITGHQQSIEYYVSAQNKTKLYFNVQTQIKVQSEISLSENVVRKYKEIRFKEKLAKIFDSVFDKKIFVDEKSKIIHTHKSQQLDLKYLFEVVSLKYQNKHFNKLSIENTDLEIIQNDILGGISFGAVCIKNCPNLIRIHKNAFGKHNDKITSFEANINLPKCELNGDYDLNELINSLVNCEELILSPFKRNIVAIKLKNLKVIYFEGSKMKIKSINDYAFYECDKIQHIGLSNNTINFINENAFHFKNQSNQQLIVDLSCNQLNQDGFALNSLINFKRPVKFLVNQNQIKYLDEAMFKQFLETNQINEIVISLNQLDINNQRNQWFQIDQRYIRRIHGIHNQFKIKNNNQYP